MFLFLHWNVVIAWALIFNDAIENPNRQIVTFDDFRKGTLPKSNRLEIFLASSKRKCALRCLKNSECSSFTFCENKSCQLNSIDAFSGEFQLIPPRCRMSLQWRAGRENETSLPARIQCRRTRKHTDLSLRVTTWRNRSTTRTYRNDDGNPRQST